MWVLVGFAYIIFLSSSLYTGSSGAGRGTVGTVRGKENSTQVIDLSFEKHDTSEAIGSKWEKKDSCKIFYEEK